MISYRSHLILIRFGSTSSEPKPLDHPEGALGRPRKDRGGEGSLSEQASWVLLRNPGYVCPKGPRNFSIHAFNYCGLLGLPFVVDTPLLQNSFYNYMVFAALIRWKTPPDSIILTHLYNLCTVRCHEPAYTYERRMHAQCTRFVADIEWVASLCASDFILVATASNSSFCLL